MNAMLRREEAPTSMLLSKSFSFDEGSLYGALRSHSEQQTAIERFEQKFGRSVYYLFYNPPELPLTITYPIKAYRELEEDPKLGARVFPAASVHAILDQLSEGAAPTHSQIMASTSHAGGWRLEEWAADLLLTCREGRRYDSPNEQQVRLLLERRSGPIGAAIEISIELPDTDNSGG